MGHGTLNTGRAAKRDRYPDDANDTRRVRHVDAESWDRDAIADMVADLVDAGFDRYADALARYGAGR